MNEAVKQILDSKGWLEIEQMFLDEFLEINKPINFRTDGKTNEQIASEVKGLEYSSKAVRRFLNKLNRIKNPIEIKKKTYI